MLKEQMAVLSKQLSSEKSHSAELQKTCDSIKESLAKLQSDYYGKESEVSALRQDLKVCVCDVHTVVDAYILKHFLNYDNFKYTHYSGINNERYICFDGIFFYQNL